ncbi:MAG: ketohydroxyglutarate aldolase [Leptolyngbya sp. SIO3F4]|nr:ketohydroxyglutarate aldolase [Leptolyngbya sp. SIO3F4]
MDKIKVNITIDDAHLEQMDQVTEELKTAGLEVEKTLSTLGIVTGSIESEKLSSLSEVTGVDAVEADTTVTLPPPGADIQ